MSDRSFCRNTLALLSEFYTASRYWSSDVFSSFKVRQMIMIVFQLVQILGIVVWWQMFQCGISCLEVLFPCLVVVVLDFFLSKAMEQQTCIFLLHSFLHICMWMFKLLHLKEPYYCMKCICLYIYTLPHQC